MTGELARCFDPAGAALYGTIDFDRTAAQQSERRMGMVLITHDFGVVATRSDHIVVMYAGQIVEQGPARELLGNPMMPYTSALMRSIPRLDGPIHSRLNVIEGRPPDLVSTPRGCRFAARCPKAQAKCLEEAPQLIDSQRPDHLYRGCFPYGEGT